jgi:hypothetical protein
MALMLHCPASHALQSVFLRDSKQRDAAVKWLAAALIGNVAFKYSCILG